MLMPDITYMRIPVIPDEPETNPAPDYPEVDTPPEPEPDIPEPVPDIGPDIPVEPTPEEPPEVEPEREPVPAIG